MNAIRNWWTALESGWRAGLKQYRKRRTELSRGPVKVGTVVPLAGPQEISQ